MFGFISTVVQLFITMVFVCFLRQAQDERSVPVNPEREAAEGRLASFDKLPSTGFLRQAQDYGL